MFPCIEEETAADLEDRNSLEPKYSKGGPEFCSNLSGRDASVTAPRDSECAMNSNGSAAIDACDDFNEDEEEEVKNKFTSLNDSVFGFIPSIDRNMFSPSNFKDDSRKLVRFSLCDELKTFTPEPPTSPPVTNPGATPESVIRNLLKVSESGGKRNLSTPNLVSADLRKLFAYSQTTLGNVM